MNINKPQISNKLTRTDDFLFSAQDCSLEEMPLFGIKSCEQRILTDKIYKNRYNLQYCDKHQIHMSGIKLGRPAEG